MLHIYHSPIQLFLHGFTFPCLPYINWKGKLIYNRVPVPLQFLHPDVVIATDGMHPLIGPFIFRDLGYLYCLVVPGWVP